MTDSLFSNSHAANSPQSQCLNPVLMWHPSIFLDCPKRVRSLPPEVACVILPEGYFRPGAIPHWIGPRGPCSPKSPPKVKCQKIIEWVWVCGHKGNGNRSHKQFLETVSPTKTTSCSPPPPGLTHLHHHHLLLGVLPCRHLCSSRHTGRKTSISQWTPIPQAASFFF